MKKLILLASAVVLFASCEKPIANAKKMSVHIYGNCGMCKETIEEATNENGVVKVDWNVDTKIAAVEFDSTKTSLDLILKRVSDAGYDSDLLKGNDQAYGNLHECCKYERKQ